MNHRNRLIRQGVRGAASAVLFALASLGCGAADLEGEPEEVAGEESIESTEEALHPYPGIPALSWRGAPPNGAQLTTNRPGLQVVYATAVGVTNKTIVGLQACWYTPSNPNNLFTNGDPWGCTIVGNTTASKWHAQACPGDQVVSGYTTKANGSNSKIVKFGTVCTSLSNPSQYTIFPSVGDPDVLFPELLNCRAPGGGTAYLEFFNSNNNFTGFNGVCVLP